MKKRMLKVVTLFIVVVSANFSFSQEIEEPKKRKHAIGISYNFSNWSIESFDFNYRRLFKNYNLKGGFELISPHNYGYKDGNSLDYDFTHLYNKPRIISSIDSSGNFVGLYTSHYQRESYVKLKLGGEKVFPSKSNVSPFIGGDVYLGIYKRTAKSSINNYVVDSSKNEDATYWDSEYDKYATYVSPINVKTTKQSNIVLGVKLNVGLIFNIREEFFVTATINYDFGASVSQKLTDSFENENFNNDFDESYSDVTYFYSQLGGSIGLNYRF